MKANRECRQLRGLTNEVGPHVEKVLELTDRREFAIQAGGYVGIYPKALAEHFEIVWTFEPSMDNLRHMLMNDMPDNVFPYRACLGDEKKTTPLYQVSHRNYGSFQTKQKGKLVHKDVLVVTLDSLLLDEAMRPKTEHSVDLIYLDIQGDEPQALLGARGTIEWFRPLIVVEICKNKCDYHPDLQELLESFGYRLVTKQRNDFYFKHEEDPL